MSIVKHITRSNDGLTITLQLESPVPYEHLYSLSEFPPPAERDLAELDALIATRGESGPERDRIFAAARDRHAARAGGNLTDLLSRLRRNSNNQNHYHVLSQEDVALLLARLDK